MPDTINTSETGERTSLAELKVASDSLMVDLQEMSLFAHRPAEFGPQLPDTKAFSAGNITESLPDTMRLRVGRDERGPVFVLEVRQDGSDSFQLPRELVFEKTPSGGLELVIQFRDAEGQLVDRTSATKDDKYWLKEFTMTRRRDAIRSAEDQVSLFVQHKPGAEVPARRARGLGSVIKSLVGKRRDK